MPSALDTEDTSKTVSRRRPYPRGQCLETMVTGTLRAVIRRIWSGQYARESCYQKVTPEQRPGGEALGREV